MHKSNKFLSFKNKSKSAPWSYISFSSKLHQKIHWNNVHFFSIKIRSNKCRNDVDFSLIEIKSSKVRWNDVNFLPIEITLKKVRKNHIDFLPMDITSRKIRQNNADFLSNEITMKNYIKMMWTFVNIFPLTYPNNIAIELMLIPHGVSIGICNKGFYNTWKQCLTTLKLTSSYLGISWVFREKNGSFSSFTFMRHSGSVMLHLLMHLSKFTEDVYMSLASFESTSVKYLLKFSVIKITLLIFPLPTTTS